ncbi:MAG: hypothetical protein N2049_07340 [Anaerolineales bacterium]|nr:hypothetical protein [Anaerolineales bacterium]MCX7609015.1 hypothetical protein [Anaerolineales bacterium]MDW8227285.1 hypothetical protein [Anaerolineales bacterium]
MALRNPQTVSFDIETWAVISADGGRVAPTLSQEAETGRVSAMSEAIFRQKRRIAGEFVHNTSERVDSRRSIGFLPLLMARNEIVVTAFKRQEVNLDLIFLAMQRATADLVRLVA